MLRREEVRLLFAAMDFGGGVWSFWSGVVIVVDDGGC
jgi:hypothetical protein